jgi:cell wall assembly regulator SMI1
VDLAEEWNALSMVVRRLAPVTAAGIRPPAPDSRVRQAEELTAPWTQELRDFYALHDGQDDIAGKGTLLPAGSLLRVSDIPDRHAFLIDVMKDVVADDEDLYGPYSDIVASYDVAGIDTDDHLFLPSYIPISRWDSNHLFCDTRPGERRGCISFRSSDGGHLGIPQWSSLASMLHDIRSAVVSGEPIGDWHPVLADGTLDWDVRGPATAVKGVDSSHNGLPSAFRAQPDVGYVWRASVVDPGPMPYGTVRNTRP